MNVLVALVYLVQLIHMRVLKLPQNIYLVQNTLNVSLTLLDVGLLNRLKSILRFLWVTFASAAMDLSKVTSAEKIAHVELIFEVQKDNGIFKGCDPIFNDLLACIVKLKAHTLCH